MMCSFLNSSDSKKSPASFLRSSRHSSCLEDLAILRKYGVIFSLFNLSKFFILHSSVRSSDSIRAESLRSNARISWELLLKFSFNTFICVVKADLFLFLILKTHDWCPNVIFFTFDARTSKKWTLDSWFLDSQKIVVPVGHQMPPLFPPLCPLFPYPSGYSRQD